MKKAIFVRKLEKFAGSADLFKVSPPIEYTGPSWDSHTTSYVVVSSVTDIFANETMAFPAYSNGEVIDWGELMCERPPCKHGKALEILGYTLVEGMGG